MTIAEQIDHMSVAEKMQTLELLWEALSADAREVPSPQWHGDVLRNRQADESQYVDWKQARKNL